MRGFFPELGTFLSEVFWRWQSWAGGGGLGGAVVVGINIYERITGKNIGRRMYLSIVIGAFLFGAFFMAWRDQHHKLLALEERLKSPELRLQTQSAWWGPLGNTLSIMASGILENPLGPPSAAINWQMRLELDSRVVEGVIPIPSGKDLRIDLSGKPGKTLVLRADQYWPKTAIQPIAAGGVSEGWLSAVFKDVSEDDIHARKPTLVISCVDVISQKRHYGRIKLGEGERGVTLPGQ